MGMGVDGVEKGGGTIYYNGKILMMDGEGRRGESMGVRGGRIVAMGTEKEVRAKMGEGCVGKDWGGGVVLPGFYAAHDHFPDLGMDELYQVDLNSPPMGGVRSIEEMVEKLRKKAEGKKAGEWVIGWGYDDTLLAEGRHPTREDLDRVSTVNPVWIVHVSGHLGVANSLGLKVAGVTRGSAVPKGGKIRLDERSGEPNGVIEEALGLVGIHLPGYGAEERQAGIGVAEKRYVERGVTTAVIAGATPETLGDLDEAVEAGRLRMRISALVVGRMGDRWPRLRAGEERIHLTGVKLRQDGSIQGYTGYLGEEYFRQPVGKAGYRGYAARSREELTAMVVGFQRKGIRMAIHGNGDGAIDDILEALAVAEREVPRVDARHRIEHAQMARGDQLARMKELGVTPSFFVGHVYYWGDRHREIFLGEERASRISPLGSALRAGLRVTVHNDTPVTPVDPLMLVWVAVNRVTSSGKVLGGGEKVSVMEALRMVTSEAAWQNFEEKDRGSLEVGKLADFVVLDRDPTEVKAMEIREIRVMSTVIGGEEVFRR